MRRQVRACRKRHGENEECGGEDEEYGGGHGSDPVLMQAMEAELARAMGSLGAAMTPVAAQPKDGPGTKRSDGAAEALLSELLGGGCGERDHHGAVWRDHERRTQRTRGRRMCRCGWGRRTLDNTHGDAPHQRADDAAAAADG